MSDNNLIDDMLAFILVHSSIFHMLLEKGALDRQEVVECIKKEMETLDKDQDLKRVEFMMNEYKEAIQAEKKPSIGFLGRLP